jgi:predicted O-methyltransferase YrrM
MLTMSLEKVCFIIDKARAFNGRIDSVEAEDVLVPGAEAARTVMAEDETDDPTYDELVEALETLNQEELAELLALVLIGRGDADAADWPTALAEAEELAADGAMHELLGTPLLGDQLEDGLAELGYDCRP